MGVFCPISTGRDRDDNPRTVRVPMLLKRILIEVIIRNKKIERIHGLVADV